MMDTVDCDRLLAIIVEMRNERMQIIASHDNAGSISHAQGGIQALDELILKIKARVEHKY